VEIPNFMELEITETTGSERGNTAQGATKPATLETGAVVQVPFHISTGDVIKVDTRTGNYIERVRTG
jgi:elongation factor P